MRAGEPSASGLSSGEQSDAGELEVELSLVPGACCAGCDSRPRILVGGLDSGATPCTEFVEWFGRTFGARARLRDVWGALDRPDWMRWFLKGRLPGLLEARRDEVDSVLSGMLYDGSPDEEACARIREAVPGEDVGRACASAGWSRPAAASSK